ncbi:alkaline phosphatase family protein [Ferruginibacter yonginensis]|uniref:Alkaline phosphatase family protein n=1 Tax=Ferruginibacter yonginensis TaxID=1310416 RepID=A0ABV8QS54_9BACT
MKHLFACFFLLSLATIPQANNTHAALANTTTDSSTNIFIITLDGFRWQELFGGADDAILQNNHFTTDIDLMESMYGGSTAEEKRKKLMPFMWQVLAKKGQLYGNRRYDNNVNVANLYAISYPGYNEIFTSTTDVTIATNNKNNNPHRNIFELLQSNPTYKDHIALFTSWDVFPYILNEKRMGIAINSGYENINNANTDIEKNINSIQTNIIEAKEATRQDMLTFIAAKEYLNKNHPKLFYLGLGETDEYAHHGNYDMYLQKANEADNIIAQLWHWAQTTPGYKNNTTFIITTDHGRGANPNKWTSHGPFTKGASQTWVALLGKNIEALGEVKNSGQLYQKQIAPTIAQLAGERFSNETPINLASK